MIAAVVDKFGDVINVIVADAGKDPAPDGYTLVNVPPGLPVGIGWTYTGGEFAPPPPFVGPPAPPPQDDGSSG